jgi:hypothetical protein
VIRLISLNRKNSQFAGHDQEAVNTCAHITSLIEAAKLHSLDALTCLADTLSKPCRPSIDGRWKI